MRNLMFSFFVLFSFSKASAQTLTLAEDFWRQQVVRTCQGFPSKEDCDDGDAIIFNGLLCMVGEDAGCDTVRLSQDGDGRFWRSPRRNPGNLGEGKTFSRDQTLGALLYLVKTKDRDAALRWLGWIEDNRYCIIKNPLTGNCSSWGYRVCRDSDKDICDMRPGTWALFKRVWEYLELPTTHEMRRNESLDVSDIEIIAADNGAIGYELHLKAVASFLRLTMASSVTKSRDIMDRLYRRQTTNPFFRILSQGPTDELTDLVLQMCPKPGDDLSFRRYQWSWERDMKSEPWHQSMGWDCIFMARLIEQYASLLP